jgi:hypothetical protein
MLLPSAAGFSDGELRGVWAASNGAVNYIAHLMGLILAALIEADQFDDTSFFFTADHSERLGSHGRLHKGAALCEELGNVPLLLKPPHRRRGDGRQTDQLVSHGDLFPHSARVVGVHIPSQRQGLGFRVLVEGGNDRVNVGVGLVTTLQIGATPWSRCAAGGQRPGSTWRSRRRGVRSRWATGRDSRATRPHAPSVPRGVREGGEEGG